MNSKMKMMKISMVLPIGYVEARKYLKAKDYSNGLELMGKLSLKVIKSLNKEMEVINLNDNLDLDGALIFSNHQENLDIFVLFSAFHNNIRFIAKKELFNLFMFKTYANLSNSYAIDRNDPRQGVKIFKQVLNDVNNGANVVVFPEGTRSKTDVMQEFNSGLFNIFKKVKKPIIPVYIDGSYDESRKDVKVIIGKPIDITNEKINGANLKQLVYDKITELKKEYGIQKRKYNILGLGDSITFGEMYDGSYGEGYYEKFRNKLNKESLLNTSYNLAVPGLTIDELINLIDTNDYDVKISKAVEDQDLVKKLVLENNIDVVKAIKNSEFLLLSIGANDILKNVISRKITKQDLYDEFEAMYQKMIILINKINKINDKIQIIYLGQYFPYPHSKTLIKFNYISTLDLYANKLELKYDNFSKIIVSKDVIENKETFLPNKRNIHLSDEGYQFVYEKFLKVFVDKTRKEHGY